MIVKCLKNVNKYIAIILVIAISFVFSPVFSFASSEEDGVKVRINTESEELDIEHNDDYGVRVASIPYGLDNIQVFAPDCETLIRIKGVELKQMGFGPFAAWVEVPVYEDVTKDDCDYSNGWWTIQLSDFAIPQDTSLMDYEWMVPGSRYYRIEFPEDNEMMPLTIKEGSIDDPQDVAAYLINNDERIAKVINDDPENYEESDIKYDKEYDISLVPGISGLDFAEFGENVIGEPLECDQSVFFTTDGSDPKDHGELFDTKYTVSKTTKVKARTKIEKDGVAYWGPLFEETFYVRPVRPRADPMGDDGPFYDSIDVTLSTVTEDAQIYYRIVTTDEGVMDGNDIGTGGTNDNGEERWTLYDGPINISADTTLRAYAAKDGIDDSEIMEETYIINSGVEFMLEGEGFGENTSFWAAKQTLGQGTHTATIITPYESDQCTLFISGEEITGVKHNDTAVAFSDDAEAYELKLNSGITNKDQENWLYSPKGVSNKIEVTVGDSTTEYSLICIPKLYPDMPDRIVDYWCINSQYTNGVGGYGGKPDLSLRGGIGSIDVAVSLGNFGGYITYYYDKPIKDDPNNPYGVDFIVYGNSYDGSNIFAEPGNILVSEDGDEWYTLAGSLHYDDSAKWGQKVTYTKKGSNTEVQLGKESAFLSKYSYPTQYGYPLHATVSEDDFESFSTTGTYLSSSNTGEGNTVPLYPAFGYADCGKSDSDSNEADNPYAGIMLYSQTNTEYGDLYADRLTSNRVGEPCDLAWAVDSHGEPVKLEGGIHYIKIQTATMIENAAIGEKSTEINMIRAAKASDSAVGVTSTPTSIKIDGKEVVLDPGNVVDATVDGIFDISVDAPETTNVYINSLRSHTAFMDKAPHNIVRVIVQEGEKEPLIYYFNIKQNAQPASNKVTAVKFDTGKGLMQDRETLTCYFDEDTIMHVGKDGGITLPKTFPANKKDVFVNWYDVNDSTKVYTEISNANLIALRDVTLMAKYDKAEDVEAASAVAEAIEALPDADKLTLADAAKVKAAQDAYDALKDDQKKLISAEDKTKLALASAVIGKLEAEDAAADLQTKLNTANEQLTAATNRVTELEGTVNTLQSQLETAQQAVRDAQTKYDALKEESDADKEELAQAKADLATAKAAEQEAKQKLEKAQIDLATAQDKVTELEGKVSDLEKDLDAEKAKAEAAQGDADKYEEELAKLKAQNAILKKTVKKVKAKAKGTKAIVSWKSVGKGFKYEVYRSTDPAKSFKKVKTAKKLKVTVKKLKKGKTYYFKVRAFKKVGGKKVYTGYSNIAKVKIKK